MTTFPRKREKIALSCSKCGAQPPVLEMKAEDPRPLHKCADGRAAAFDTEVNVADMPKRVPRFAI